MLKRLASALALVAGPALVAAPALAADLPSVKAPPAPPAPLFTTYNWTGLYAGLDLGGVWGSAKFSTPGFASTLDGDSVLGGAFIGYNRQYGAFVVGLEGDVQGLGADKTSGLLRFRQNLLASVNGRVGYAFDRVLIYAIGGVAFTDSRFDIGATRVDGETTGYDVGGGVEYAFLPNWTVRAEYRYYDFGKTNRTITTGGVAAFPTPWSVTKTDNTFRAGVAYKFSEPDSAPVVAKY